MEKEKMCKKINEKKETKYKMLKYKNIAKNSSWIIMALILGMLSCKRNLEMPEEEVNDMAVGITASKNAIATPDAGNSSTTKEVFTYGDQIGLFTQLKTNADASNNTTIKDNALYSYDYPTWEPNSVEDKLQYSDDGAIYIYAYYPYNNTINTSVITHTVDKEQNDIEQLEKLDLLWAEATNNANGFEKQRDVVSLQFSHVMTKVSFYVRMIDSKPELGISTEKIYLDSISVIGQQIIQETNFNVLTGKHQNKTQTENDTISWCSQEIYGKEFKIVAQNDEPTYITDMLLVPFEAEEGLNKFRYAVNFLNNTELKMQNFATKIPAHNSGTSLQFDANKHNKVIVTIDVSTGNMAIDATIVDWDTTGPETELDADRD